MRALLVISSQQKVGDVDVDHAFDRAAVPGLTQQAEHYRFLLVQGHQYLQLLRHKCHGVHNLAVPSQRHSTVVKQSKQLAPQLYDDDRSSMRDY